MKGKLLGAILGALAGGPIGAIIGSAVGHCAVDANSKKQASEGSRRMSHEDADFFLAHLCAACAKMAKANGSVSRAEIDALEHVFMELGITGEKREMAVGYFRRAKSNEQISFIDIVSSFARRGFSASSKILFFRVLARVALADGNVDNAEFAYLRQAARALGIPTSVVDRLKSEYFEEDRAGGGKGNTPPSSEASMTLAEAYVVMGVDFGTDKETVKKIYRQKCKDLHPDVLRSKGLGDFAVKVLEQELQKVNDAYSVIEKYGS